mmetsp:Transcript_34378/g.106736  ORF Transcript_34378/g.106736 Transcript_34378/m.106736 type:complete len:219 (-) Transcript_34378:910-1566(-)
MVLKDVLAQELALLGLFHANVPQARHHGGDAADERGEGNHGGDKHADREDTLIDVPRHNLHGRRSELRQAPVQRRGVAVARVAALDLELRYPPVRGLAQERHGVPAAGDEVVDDDDKQEGLHDGDRSDEALRHEAPKNLLDELWGLHHPHKPEDPEDAGEPQGLRDAGDADNVCKAGLQRDEDPVRQEDEDVHEEPSADVVPRYLARPHLDGASLVEP